MVAHNCPEEGAGATFAKVCILSDLGPLFFFFFLLWGRTHILKEFPRVSNSYLVAIVSNQKAISLRKDAKGSKNESKSHTVFKQKVTEVMKDLDVPLSVYAATENDEFRKPRMGMWKEILDDYDLDIEGAVDLEGSIFVGDAAGRSADHSCSDR